MCRTHFGWGHIRHLINFSNEVCNECFEVFMPICNKIEDAFTAREGINKTQVAFIQNNKEWDSDTVPDVQQDKSQQERRRNPLLRLLPFFSNKLKE